MFTIYTNEYIVLKILNIYKIKNKQELFFFFIKNQNNYEIKLTLKITFFYIELIYTLKQTIYVFNINLTKTLKKKKNLKLY